MCGFERSLTPIRASRVRANLTRSDFVSQSIAEIRQKRRFGQVKAARALPRSTAWERFLPPQHQN
ncbi:hypothetical protein THIOM_003638 [Candidatus Thiomargarita nelsonii]|uniref:Uncharacterized protein n=1 Tax=Candidatus Thiomargarita nelsonii TaxID=1003181 RepID=A0A176RXY3_9GAMM|nr:hypothetical protein THIOM_003638 [Candidatus Thiomargarita nelsonii]